MKIDSFSEEDTKSLGLMTAKEAKKGDIFCLDGDLGTGKTVFARGFAEGLDIKEDITSPTFTIVKEYQGGKFPLYHFDVYRIADPSEMEAIGYEEYFYGDGVCLIEWSEQIADLIPETAVHVKIGKVPEKGFDYRRIEFD